MKVVARPSFIRLNFKFYNGSVLFTCQGLFKNFFVLNRGRNSFAIGYLGITYIGRRLYIPS